MFNLFKLFTYQEDISTWQSQLIELQQAYKDLEVERNKVYITKLQVEDLLNLANTCVDELKSKVAKLESENKDLDIYNSTLQAKFDNQEEFISKLKDCSNNLNNLFFEDNERRY